MTSVILESTNTVKDQAETRPLAEGTATGSTYSLSMSPESCPATEPRLTDGIIEELIYYPGKKVPSFSQKISDIISEVYDKFYDRKEGFLSEYYQYAPDDNDNSEESRDWWDDLFVTVHSNSCRRALACIVDTLNQGNGFNALIMLSDYAIKAVIINMEYYDLTSPFTKPPWEPSETQRIFNLVRFVVKEEMEKALIIKMKTHRKKRKYTRKSTGERA